MSDRDLPPEERARLRVQQVIEDELARAGLQLEGWQVNELAADLVAGDKEDPDVRQFMRLLQLGQGVGTGIDPRNQENQGVRRQDAIHFGDEFGDMYGFDPEELWANQRQGWGGYGWNREKRQELGRNEESREFSRDGRWANTWRANLSLAEALLNQQDAIKVEEAQRDMLQNPSEARIRVLARLLDEHQRLRSQTHGESGFFGAMMNPEYLVGSAINSMNTFPEAAHMQTLDTADPRENPHYIPEHLKSSWLVDPIGNLGHQATQYAMHYYPKARSLGEVIGLANAVEPALPIGTTPAEGNRQIQEAAGRRNLSLDELYREKTGEYPSFAASKFATLLNGLIDPSIFATGPAAHMTHTVGRGLLGAGRAIGKGTLGGDFLRRWGTNLMRDASWAKQYPYAAAAVREAGDEGPFNAGIEGLAAATSPQTPHPDTWAMEGNEARTDLYQPDPSTGELRPETQKEFRDRTFGVQQDSRDMMNRNFLLMDRVRRGRLPEPATPATPLMHRLGTVGAGGH